MVSNSDLAFLITTLVAVKQRKKEKKKRRWSKEWYKMRNRFTHEHLLNFLCDSEPEDYRNFLRMDHENFDYLLDLLRPDIEKKDTKMREAIPASQRLSITLRYLSSGMDLEDLKFTCAIAPQTLHLIIMETCSAIIKALKENIQIEQSSPQLSVDRLSVSFAKENTKQQESNTDNDFPENKGEDENVNDEYSASATAIMEKGQRGSWRRRSSKRRRRSSSPLSISLRRRSSVFTTSSGDTGIMIEDDNEEQIFQNMRIHKEVVARIKYQPWPIQKKLRLVQEAKSYLKQHEGQIQERLAQRTSAKDVIAHINILIINHWNFIKRELTNIVNNMIPWEPRIKQIESHFGSVVASYFTFLRWLFSVNAIMTIVLVVFLAMPEVLLASYEVSGERKKPLIEDSPNASNFLTLWNFEGVLKYSPLFYGFYNSETKDNTVFGNWLPLVYFMVSLGVYVYSFVAILRKMAVNSRQSKLSEKDDDCIFTWKMFTSWDFMIGNPETAHNRRASIILGFKEALLEEAEKTREEGRNWKLFSVRIFTNFNVIWLLASSMYAVIKVVERSEEPNLKGWWRQNEVTVAMTLIGTIYPIIFDGISYLEKYHPRKALRLQLARIMVLNLLNLYSFIFATFSKIQDMSSCALEIKLNLTKTIPNITEMKTKRFSSPRSVVTESLVIAALILTNHTTYLSNSAKMGNFTSNSENINTLPTFEFETLDDSFNYTTENPLLFNEGLKEPFKNETTTYFRSENVEQNFNKENLSSEETLTTSQRSSSSENDFSTTRSDEINSTILPKSYITNERSTIDFISNISSTGLEKINSTNRKSTVCDKCTSQPDSPRRDLSLCTCYLDTGNREKLHTLCWETMFGQELVKLTVLDLFMTVLGIIMGDFVRALFVRFMNSCWCWDLEKKFPQYADFKIAENILHLVNNQGMVWMGMFFSPGLPLINLLKLIIIMYMRSWAVLTCNIPHEVVFRASRSNNFYFGLLLTMLFLCVLPVGYALVWIEPSWHCGPFSNYLKIYHIFTSNLKKLMPRESFNRVLDYIASPGIIIPLLMLLVLIIYYLLSLTNALREANDDLKVQLRRERTEERRKMFQIANKKRRGTEPIDSQFNRWCKFVNANSSRNISLDNTTNTIKDEINHIKSVDSIQENKNVDSMNDGQEVNSGHKTKNLKENRKSEIKLGRKDSVTSSKSVDNIPEIKISKTESLKNVLDSQEKAPQKTPKGNSK